MKLPFPIIAGALFAGLTVAADQVTTQNGSILVGKAQIAQNGQVQIAGQTLPTDQVQRIIFESNALQPGLSRVTFNLYQGNWNALPDFTQLSIDKSGTMSTNRLQGDQSSGSRGPIRARHHGFVNYSHHRSRCYQCVGFCWVEPVGVLPCA